nr:asparagine synthase (glutamine-hydrolyzing) [uncultured Sphingomonas sp.]
MCGITGIVGPGSRSDDLLRQMTGRLAHRGPDDQGLWADPVMPLAFGHRRLSIVDLSPAGHQPMSSKDGRWVICYNGEIYNHLDIRQQLEAARTIPWQGHSDTETLIEAIATWGVEGAVAQAVGMFALAVLDRREAVLWLARDRFGEKPLYYGHAGRDLLFASELKPFHKHPDFAPDIDRDAVVDFASRGYIRAPRSIFKNVHKLPPGHLLSVAVTGERFDLSASRPYWRYESIVAAGRDNPFPSHREALLAVDAALHQSIAGQSVADVPVGTFLSGGIDSSLITAVNQHLNPGRVNSFTIGFDEAGYDESADARAIAKHLGTQHHEFRVGSADAQAIIPSLPEIYDEPFADSSQIPTYLVSKLARAHVTVALSGDGGDELFGGYNRYTRLPRMWSILSSIPTPLRKAGGSIASLVPERGWNHMVMLARGGRPADHIGAKMAKFSRLAASLNGIDDLTASFLDEWVGDKSPVRGGNHQPTAALPLSNDTPLATRLMLADAIDYLPDDILCKVDRAAMACSLETRVPFLDHRLAEAAARIPISMNIQGSTGKQILRDLLARYVPEQLFDRPKAGFAVPIGRWLRTDLRDWAEDLLDPRSLEEDGLFDSSIVHARWSRHLSGQADATQAIWSVLMFQSWRRHWSVN